MKTFLGIYGFLQVVTILWWIYIMFTTKPKHNRGSNRFIKNWNEGGQYTLYGYSFVSFLLAFMVLLVVVLFKLIDKIL